jgi:hypothetical protein
LCDVDFGFGEFSLFPGSHLSVWVWLFPIMGMESSWFVLWCCFNHHCLLCGGGAVVVGGYAVVALLFRQFRFYNGGFSYLATFLFSNSLIGFQIC